MYSIFFIVLLVIIIIIVLVFLIIEIKPWAINMGQHCLFTKVLFFLCFPASLNALFTGHIPYLVVFCTSIGFCIV